MKLIKAMLAVLTVTLLSSACTKVEVPVENELTPDNFPKNEAQFLLASGSAYAKFRDQFATTYWQLQSLSSDEAILPTRGSNWFDGGRYQQLHYHTWTPYTHKLRVYGVGVSVRSAAVIRSFPYLSRLLTVNQN